MIKLTERQTLYLIKNEDALTLRKFAELFHCTAKEVYEAYDEITKTKGYKKYVTEKVAKITNKLKRGEDENEQMESTCEDTKNRGESGERLPYPHVLLNRSELNSDTSCGNT